MCDVEESEKRCRGGARLVQEYLERCVVQLVAYGGGVKEERRG